MYVYRHTIDYIYIHILTLPAEVSKRLAESCGDWHFALRFLATRCCSFIYYSMLLCLV